MPRNTYFGLGGRSASTLMLLLAVLGTALAMPPQFGIHDLQRRGGCDEFWNLTSCMTCEFGEAVPNEPGYMWVRMDFTSCKSEAISWIGCCEKANPGNEDVCLGPLSSSDCDSGKNETADNARACLETRMVSFAVESGATSFNIHLHDGQLGDITSPQPPGWTPPTTRDETCGGGFRTCAAQAAVIDLSWCTYKGPNPNPPPPTCAAVDCSQYSANGVPMQYKSDANLTETCVGLGSEDCNATCCALRCSTPPSLPSNANNGTCGNVPSVPLLNDQTCDIACDANFVLSGSSTYTCDDGALQNPITTVCLPTCAAVNCSEYSANGVPMQYKNGVNLSETCDNLGGDDCKATCCAPRCSTPPSLPSNANNGTCGNVPSVPLLNDQTCDIACNTNYVLSGNPTYTCDDGSLENSTAIVCQPTCATVVCSSLTTTYFFATVPMKSKDGRVGEDICDGDCVPYCCEANPPTVPFPVSGTGFAKDDNQDLKSGNYCAPVTNPATKVAFSRSNKNWGFVNYLDLVGLTTAGKSETAKFFAGAGQCSATNKGSEVGEVSIFAVPGTNNTVNVTITYTLWPGQAILASSPRIQLTANQPYPTNPWGAGPGQYTPATQTCTPVGVWPGTQFAQAASCTATINVATLLNSMRYIYYVAHANVIIPVVPAVV